jgi:hypothetical protein
MDILKNKYQIVVARYNEDIKWLLPYKEITTIYNKGDYNPLLHKFNVIYLNNVGRESHTYLYHIIENYDNLADKTIFFQGNLSDHSEKVLDIEDYFQNDSFIGKIDKYDMNKLKEEITHFGKYKKDLKIGNLRKSNYLPYNWLVEVVGLDIDKILIETNVVWNANFSVSKELIKSKPIEFYQNIIRFINNHPNPEEGHFLERSWYLIFHSNYIKKEIIKYQVTNNSSSLNKLKELYRETDTETNKENQIHLWTPISANDDVGINHKIYFMKSINKYTTINTPIIDNTFSIGIKSSNDVSILIELKKNIQNQDIQDNCYIEPTKYEIILGVFNNSKSIIRNCNDNKIIYSYENSTLDPNNYINFTVVIDNYITIKKDNNIIFRVYNKSNITPIESIKIKNNGSYNTYLSYDHISDNNDNIKVHLVNNHYEDIDYYYKQNYLNHYVDKIY